MDSSTGCLLGAGRAETTERDGTPGNHLPSRSCVGQRPRHIPSLSHNLHWSTPLKYDQDHIFSKRDARRNSCPIHPAIVTKSESELFRVLASYLTDMGSKMYPSTASWRMPASRAGDSIPISRARAIFTARRCSAFSPTQTGKIAGRVCTSIWPAPMSGRKLFALIYLGSTS